MAPVPGKLAGHVPGALITPYSQGRHRERLWKNRAGHCLFTSVLAAGDIFLWERIGQRKDVQLFIWPCLLGRRGLWRAFSYCTGQGSMSWAEALPGSPQKCRVALLARGVLFVGLFCFPFPPSVTQRALGFPAGCSFTSRKTSLGSEREKKGVLAKRCLTGF